MASFSLKTHIFYPRPFNQEFENVSLALDSWHFSCLSLTHTANYSCKKFCPMTYPLARVHPLRVDGVHQFIEWAYSACLSLQRLAHLVAHSCGGQWPLTADDCSLLSPETDEEWASALRREISLTNQPRRSSRPGGVLMEMSKGYCGIVTLQKWVGESQRISSALWWWWCAVVVARCLLDSCLMFAWSCKRNMTPPSIR